MTALDLEAIVSDEMKQSPAAFAIESFEVEASNVRAPLAQGGRADARRRAVESGSFTGDGPVDAFFSAINAATGHDARLKEFHVSAVTGGRDALGEVTVLLELDGRHRLGRGRLDRHPRGVGQGLPARAVERARPPTPAAEAEHVLEHEARRRPDDALDPRCRGLHLARRRAADPLWPVGCRGARAAGEPASRLPLLTTERARQAPAANGGGHGRGARAAGQGR